eukprot:968918-Rhodomonas_salina.2
MPVILDAVHYDQYSPVAWGIGRNSYYCVRNPSSGQARDSEMQIHSEMHRNTRQAQANTGRA